QGEQVRPKFREQLVEGRAVAGRHAVEQRPQLVSIQFGHDIPPRATEDTPRGAKRNGREAAPLRLSGQRRPIHYLTRRRQTLDMDLSMRGSFHLFRLAGISVYLHWSWFLVAVLQISWRPDEYRGNDAWKVAEYLALFAVVLTHEFGHALACRS